MGGGPIRRRPQASSASPIRLDGVRVHNLRSIDVEIPRNRLTVITGVSGSGQVVAGLRHALRRRPPSLRRVPVDLPAAVPRDGWRARPSSPRAACRRRSRSSEAVPAAQARSTVGTTTEVTTTCGCCSPASASTTASAAARPVRGRRAGRRRGRADRHGWAAAWSTFDVDPPGNGRRWRRLQQELASDGFRRVVARRHGHPRR